MAAELARKMVCEGEGEKPCGLCRHCRKALSGTHPDIVYVERDKDDKGNLQREMKVDKMRRMLADAWVRPNEALRKVYVIRDAQTMNVHAQNAILKLLEEPPGNACFILCADNAAAMLDTVRSRCIEINGAGELEQSCDAEMDVRVGEYLRLAAKRDLPALLKLLSAWEKLDTDGMRALIGALRSRLPEILCLRSPNFGMDRARIAALMELAMCAEEYLRANVGTKHILGLLSVRTIEL